MIVSVVRENVIGNAIPSKIYLDGAFFAYGLENINYSIPAGTYSAYGKTSPKFGSEKVYINVPGREAILFHGGNSAEDSKGCIIVASKRIDDSTVQGDKSGALFDAVDAAYKRGETITVEVKRDSYTIVKAVLVAAAVAVFVKWATQGTRAK